MNHPQSVYVIGAGGHAKVIIRALQDLGHTITTIFDDDQTLHGKFLLGIPVVAPIEQISEYPSQPTVIAIGENGKRRCIAERYDLPWMSIIHPRAFVDASVRIGRGTVVLAQTVVQVDSVLGDHVIINHAATVDHDCTIGDYSHLAPGVHLAGEVTVREEVLLGVGTVVAPRVLIGQGSVVGAGAAVIRDLPPGIVAVGVPARVVKSRPSTVQQISTPNQINSEAA